MPTNSEHDAPLTRHRLIFKLENRLSTRRMRRRASGLVQTPTPIGDRFESRNRGLR